MWGHVMAGILGVHDVSLVQDKALTTEWSFSITAEVSSGISRSSVWEPRQAIVVARTCGVLMLGSGGHLQEPL